MRVAFAIYNFVDAKLPLQPWLTVQHVAQGLVRKGCSVHVVTDVGKPAQIEGVASHSVASLRGSNSTEMRVRLTALRPDVLVFLPTPLNIVTASWLDGLSCRCIGFASYPFYNAGELATATRCLGWSETRQYLRHLLIPRFVWRRAMRRRLHALIAQSSTTANRLQEALASELPSYCIPPGIDLSQWPGQLREHGADRNAIRLLYLGAATTIRGFDLALDALARIRDSRVRLRVLARGADADDVAKIRTNVLRYGLNGQVDIEGGWIDRTQLISEIQAADAVLQPFVLVPSELPVTAMEVIACGTPVIGSAIDGLPSTIGPAGTVVRQGSVEALADAIVRFVQDVQVRSAWQDGCRRQREAMFSWDAVVDRWEAVFRDEA